MTRFKPQFTVADVRRMAAKKKQQMRQAMLMRLKRVGEQFIADARENGAYTDQTGNLRNSIGYIILDDGVQIDLGGFGNGEGAARGEQLALELSDKYTSGLVLIVVAGMEYAAAVESLGFDVLTMSGVIAGANLKKQMQQLAQKI